MNKSNAFSSTGVVVDLSGFSDWDGSFKELMQLINSRRSFWGNSSIILRLGDFPLKEDNVSALKNLLAFHHVSLSVIQTNSLKAKSLLEQSGFEVIPAPLLNVAPNGSGIKLIKHSQVIPIQKKQVIEQVLPARTIERKTAYIGSQDPVALRAGQFISYDGNIVIIGDVNPGCQIRATGSIIVYGKLCGSVHAGFGLTEKAEIDEIFVKALKMGDPLQISISEYTACSSTENKRHSKYAIYPETAKVIDGRIWRISDFD
jgi:septum formation inhibitor MinC